MKENIFTSISGGVKQDIKHLGNYTLRNVLKYSIMHYSFSVIFLFRILHALKGKKLYFFIYAPLYAIFKIKCQFYGFTLPVETKIGGGLYFAHYGSVVISDKAIIGKNLIMMQNTTIGSNWTGSHPGTPIIGNNCVMCANSVVVGGINVGNNVFIGAGSVVSCDVPDNSLVVGNPARIIPDKGKIYTDNYLAKVL